MTTTISADGLIQLPDVFRKTDAIEAGQRFEIERVGRGEYRVSARPARASQPARSLTDVLLACPVKGFLIEPERGQTTDDLPENPLV